MFYDAGREQALRDLGLLHHVKEAKVLPLLVKARKNPFMEIHRKIKRLFKLKMPKFDMNKLLSRMFRNPFRIPQRQLSGKTPPLKM